MTPNIEPRPDIWVGEYENLPITSVGLLLLSNQRIDPYTYVLLVEQLDQQVGEEHPWGIVAGRWKRGDITPEDIIRRELKEETGLPLPRNLKPFLHIERGSPDNYEGKNPSAKLVFTGYCPLATMLEALGDYQRIPLTRAREPLLSRGRFQPPSVYISNLSFSEEIGRRALITLDELFDARSPIRPLYRWDIMHGIKGRLEGLNVI